MQKEELDRIIAQIAKENNTTSSHVRSEMENAIKIAQRSKNQSTQAKWAAIPHKGSTVTLEEFMDYMIYTLDKLTSS